MVRFRDVDGQHRTVTVNAKNLDKYGLSIPTRITERVANCQLNLKQWETIFAMYTDDNNSGRKILLKELWHVKWAKNFNLTAPLPNWESEAPWMANFKGP